MKRSDVILLIAIWEFITALPAFAGVIALGAFSIPAILATENDVLAGVVFFISLGIVLLLAWVGLAVAAGVGLLTRQEWGRILAIIHAALSLVRIPFGTVIGALVLVYLTRKETREYLSHPGEEPGPPSDPPWSPLKSEVARLPEEEPGPPSDAPESRLKSEIDRLRQEIRNSKHELPDGESGGGDRPLNGQGEGDSPSGA